MRLNLRSLSIAIASTLTLAAPAAHAQRAGRGYLFHQPELRITLRGGYALANANSELFDDATRFLTLNKSDFSGFAGGFELGVPVSDRFEITADIGYSRAAHSSEFRDFVDNNDLPIEQRTEFQRVPITLNTRVYLNSPGRSIGKLAWIPSRVTSYLGAGVGAVYYRYSQNGDFVDFRNNNVFPAILSSDGWAPAVQGLGGAEFSLTPMLAISTDVRYIMARGMVSQDFAGFNKIDLSGVSGAVGLTFRL